MSSLAFKEQVLLILLEKEKEPYGERRTIIKEAQYLVEDVCEAEAVPHLDSVHPGIVPEINQMYVMAIKREVPLRYRVNKT